jgi:uncharacterized membrane protein
LAGASRASPPKAGNIGYVRTNPGSAFLALTVLFALVSAPALSHSWGVLAATQPAGPSAAPTSQSLLIEVHSDGSVTAKQSFNVSAASPSMTATLVSSVISDIIVLDQNGSPLSFQDSGRNLTVYTVGATGVQLRYDTLSLTDKNGTVWTLSLVSAYNATVVLPYLSTLTSTSGSPTFISDVGGYPTIQLASGVWTLTYGAAIQGTTSATGSSESSTHGSSGGSGAVNRESLIAAVIVAVVVLLVLSLFLFRRRSRRADLRSGLRPDDVKVLEFIRQKGGRVLEPEVRMTFALPKTSAWRQIKRLERLGYVKITKIGSQNQIELTKRQEAGDF